MEGQIRATCGHLILEDAEVLDAQQLEIILKQAEHVCDDCHAKSLGYVWDSRAGAYVTPVTLEMSRKIASDPMLFVDKGNYAAWENVEDGDGLG